MRDVEEPGPRERLGQPSDGPQHAVEGLAEALPPVRGDEHEIFLRRGTLARGELLERVHDGVSGQVHASGWRALRPQGGRGPLRRREIGAGDDVDDASVHLLRERPVQVPGAQAGLDVPDGDAAVEGGDRSAHRRGRVALDEEPVGPALRQQRIERAEDPRRELARGLVVAHQVEIDVGRQVEQLEDLVEHLAMLRGRAEDDVEAVRLRAQPLNHGRHLDGLGPRPHDHDEARACHALGWSGAGMPRSRPARERAAASAAAGTGVSSVRNRSRPSRRVSGKPLRPGR